MNYLLDRACNNCVITNIKTKKRDIALFALLVIPFFYPPFLGTFDSLEFAYNVFYYLRFFSLLCCSILFVLNIRHIYFTNVNFFILVFAFYLLLVTAISRGDLKTALSFVSQCFVIFVCFSLFFRTLDKRVAAVNTMYYYLLALTIIDIIVLLFVKDANLSILGPKNNHVYYLLPLLFFGIYKSYADNKSKYKLICMFAVVIDCVLEFSVTTIFSVSFFFLMYCLVALSKRARISIKLIFCISLVISLSLAFLSESVLKNILNDVVGFFGKSDTFGRFEIWNAAAKLIKEKPLFGYGIESSEIVRMHFNDLNHAHNRYLDVLYMGGIVGLVMFMIPIVSLNTRALKEKSILYILLVSYAILYITEGKRIDAGFVAVLLTIDLIATEKRNTTYVREI